MRKKMYPSLIILISNSCLLLLIFSSCSKNTAIQNDSKKLEVSQNSTVFTITDSYKVTDLHTPPAHRLAQLQSLPVARRPSQELIEKYKDPTVYGIWIDDKRISNSELNKYRPDEFEYYKVRGLEENALHYGIYKYQVTLLTAEGFRKLKNEILYSNREYKVI